jgi:hypothetical protein
MTQLLNKKERNYWYPNQIGIAEGGNKEGRSLVLVVRACYLQVR